MMFNAFLFVVVMGSNDVCVTPKETHVAASEEACSGVPRSRTLLATAPVCASPVSSQCVLQNDTAELVVVSGGSIDGKNHRVDTLIASGSITLKNMEIANFRFSPVVGKETIVIEECCGRTAFAFYPPVRSVNTFINLDGSRFERVTACGGVNYGGVIALAHFSGTVTATDATVAVFGRSTGKVNGEKPINISFMSDFFGARYEAIFLDDDAVLDSELTAEATMLGGFFALSVLSLFIAHSDLFTLAKEKKKILSS